jgi:hypothetical protein
VLDRVSIPYESRPRLRRGLFVGETVNPVRILEDGQHGTAGTFGRRAEPRRQLSTSVCGGRGRADGSADACGLCRGHPNQESSQPTTTTEWILAGLLSFFGLVEIQSTIKAGRRTEWPNGDLARQVNTGPTYLLAQKYGLVL